MELAPALPPLPVGVTDPASVFFQDHLVICGGMDTGNDWTSSCYGLESNALNATWKTLSPLNIARSDFTLTKVVIGGGGKVDSLDLSTLEWSSLPPLPVENLQGYGCVALEDAGEEKIIVTGGWRQWPKPRSQSKCYGWPADGEFLSQVYLYNGSTWRQTGQLMGPRSYHAMAVLGGRPLVLGGDHGDFEQCQKVRVLSVERMGEGRSWEKLPADLIKKLAGGGPAIYTVATVPANKFPCEN